MENKGNKNDDDTSEHHDAEISPRYVQKDEQVEQLIPKFFNQFLHMCKTYHCLIFLDFDIEYEDGDFVENYSSRDDEVIDKELCEWIIHKDENG